MTTNWDDARKKIGVFKKYMKNAPKSVSQKKGYLITREEIEKILKQKQGKLDGIRIYFGGEIVEDFMVPTLVVVGCEKDENGKYNDFQVPDSLKTLRENQKNGNGEAPKAAKSLIANGTGSLSLVAGLHPCPAECSTKNVLNM
ncbi:hypothetical protein QTN47_14780 [Danxiaibacter flavus]|uniref:Uncharacterized protein n=1 Tax=Danxiaibacter flavus TaxID=3049108 RepID=A0ABV3ZH15_9BACT|nr:hypothetical protein QNM32_14790 [Chitinophagaceae bacterium DXS]